MQGFISLHRKLMENPVWSDPNYLKLWVYCLFKASHKEHEVLIGNQVIKLERGQFVTGRKVLFEDMNKGVKPDQQLSEKTWSRYLKNLEKWQMLTINVTNKFSVVTIVNYGVYQDSSSKIDHQTDLQLAGNWPASDRQVTTYNKVNNVNNGKEKIYLDFPIQGNNFFKIYNNHFFFKFGKNHPRISEEKYSEINQWIVSIKDSVSMEEFEEFVIHHFDNLPKGNDGKIFAFIPAFQRYYLESVRSD